MTAPTLPLPAVCERCGVIFKSGAAVGGGAVIHSFGSRSGPCPNCGGWGQIPDGAWDVAHIVREYLSQNVVPQDQMAAFLRLASEAAGEPVVDMDALKAKTEQEAPALSRLVELLRDPATAGAATVLGLVVALLSLWVAMSQSAPATQTVINNYHSDEQHDDHHHEQDQRGDVGSKDVAPGEDAPSERDEG